MYEALINIRELDPQFFHQLMNYLFVEPKDNLSLKVAREALLETHPGDYQVTKWVNVDDSYDLSVYAEFNSKEEFLHWLLKSQQS